MAQPPTKDWDATNRGAGAYSTPGVDTRPPANEFSPLTATPIVRFKLQEVDPPSLVYVRPFDSLNLRVITEIAAGATVTFLVRLLKANGEIQINTFVVTAPTPGVGVNSPQNLPEGYLLSVIASGPPATVRGQTFASATLRYLNALAGAVIDNLPLFADYVTASTPIGWPAGEISSPTDRNGHLRSITGTTPAAGAEISEVCPTATRWRLLAFRYTLTTAVAAANRETNLQIDDGVNPYATDTAATTQAASLAFIYSYMVGVNRQQALQSNLVTIGLPTIVVEAGHRIRTSTTNIQAADQYSAPQYLVEEWLTQG